MQSDLFIVRGILKQNEFLLRRHLVLSQTVLDKLRDGGVISDVTRRKISSAQASSQVKILLNALWDRGLHSFKKFLDVLKSTGHSWMVDHILDTSVTTGEQTQVQARRSQEDSGSREGSRESTIAIGNYTRPTATHFPSYMTSPSSPRRRTVTFDPSALPKTVPFEGVSLANILKAREPKQEPEAAYVPSRGVINARTMFTDPTVLRPHTIAPGGQVYTTLPGIPQQIGTTKEEIPMTLYKINEAFAEQESHNQQALCVLRQEQVAIRQLMDQNARDEANVRRKQAAVNDIATRLRDIHHRAREVYQPAPHPSIGRYRLAQLNQIPWSIDK